MNITLDEKHIYRVDGIIKPSVTEVVKQEVNNGAVSPYFNDFYAERGHIIHEGCALIATSKYKVGSIDERLAGYMESCRLAMDKFKLTTEAVEQMFYDPATDVCGTIDWRGTSPFFPHSKVFVDWKAGVPQHPDWELQGAGYLSGAINSGLIPMPLAPDAGPVFVDIKLHSNGKCGTLMVPKNFGEYIAAWPHIAAAYHFKKKHGLLPTKENKTNA